MPYTPPPLPTYRFKNGAVATIHTIGQMTIAHIAAGAQKKVPPVPIPIMMVDMATGRRRSQIRPTQPISARLPSVTA